MDRTIGATRMTRNRTTVLWSDYLSLTKPRVVSLLLLTMLIAMLITPAGFPSWMTIGLTLLGGYLAAGGAGAINCYLDRDIDAVMSRTRQRPLPAGRIAPLHALVFGVLLSVLAFVILALGVNLLAAVLTAAGGGYYVIVYTLWLKRRSPQNIVIGGVAGAFPPLVGWAAATGTLAPLPLILFAVIVLWTPPHFWALALLRQTEYARAGVPMLPVVRGIVETKRQIVRYTALLIVCSLLPATLSLLGPIYIVGALLLNLRLWRIVIKLRCEPGIATAWMLYKWSLLYLALLFAALALDQIVQQATL